MRQASVAGDDGNDADGDGMSVNGGDYATSSIREKFIENKV
jgi:hypothetical protein